MYYHIFCAQGMQNLYSTSINHIRSHNHDTSVWESAQRQPIPNPGKIDGKNTVYVYMHHTFKIVEWKW